MDLKDIKEAKFNAQQRIQSVLHELHSHTGLMPMEVEFEIIDRTTMMDEERQYSVGMVKITMEAL